MKFSLFSLILMTVFTAQPVSAAERAGVAAADEINRSIAGIPANELSNLYTFQPNRAPDFMKVFETAKNKTAKRRSGISKECSDDMAAILKRRAPAAIRVQPLPKILAATSALGINEDNVRYTLAAYQSHEAVLRNNRFMTIIEFGRPSNQPRMFVIDLATARVRAYKTTHGRNSGGHSAAATKFSNTDGSYQSSVGCAVTGEFYHGKYNNSMRLHGLEVGKNDNMCTRSIVMHKAGYAASGGRSQGCPAVEPGKINEIYDQIENGSMFCSFGNGDRNYQMAEGQKPPRKKKRNRGWRRG